MILPQCPHCGVKHVQARQVLGAVSQADGHDTWNVMACQNPTCGHYILVIVDPAARVKSIHPAGHHEFEATVDIPEVLRADFREAGRCLDAACFKASMVMSRRALQRVLKAQGCEHRKLVDAINAAIKQGVLRKAFHSLAEEVREYGNLSAHPDDDQLDNATKEAAEHVMEFVRLIVEEFYEVPSKASRLRKQRETPSL
jgi:Domain of unknown function (DUF4145)